MPGRLWASPGFGVCSGGLAVESLRDICLPDPSLFSTGLPLHHWPPASLQVPDPEVTLWPSYSVPAWSLCPCLPQVPGVLEASGLMGAGLNVGTGLQTVVLGKGSWPGGCNPGSQTLNELSQLIWERGWGLYLFLVLL